MRTGGSARRPSFAGQPLDGPVPISAVKQLNPNIVLVTFDQPLVAGPLNAGNWSGEWDSFTRNGSSASASGAVVTVTTTPGTPTPLPDTIDYSAAAALRVIGLNTGIPADPFTDFPVT